MNDSHYPWLILVPRRADVTEIVQLNEGDQVLLLQEINHVAEALQGLFAVDKLNIAALGNMVPQLHIHCIGRFTTDAAWPKPVWGVVEAAPYPATQLAERLAAIRSRLSSAGLRQAL